MAASALRFVQRAVPDWIPMVSGRSLRADVFAGLTGATLALPQSVAFAAIAGLPPQYGFYTAMVTPVVAALFGSSWHAVSGPATAISALVFGALAGSYAPGSPEFISAAILLALLVGAIQLGLALARLGGIVDFVSHSVMTGFITGAALIIALGQVRHALGLDLPRPDDLFAFGQALVLALPEISGASAATAGIAVLSGAVIKKIWPLAPNYLIALVLASAFSIYLLPEGSVATIGHLERITPVFAVPDLSLERAGTLASAALAIALVGLLEAMSIARALAMKSGQMVDGNREFFGQGLSNVVGSFFACYPGSASFTRSGVNYDAGARTPLAAVFSSLLLVLILLLVARWFALVPIPAMAGVILLVAWRLVDVKEIRHILSTSPSETIIATTTFLSAVLLSLEFAIYSGVFLSFAFFLKKTSRPFIGIGAPDPETPQRMFRNAALHGLPECPQMLVTRLDGPLYFGSVEYLRRQFRQIEAARPDQKHMLFIVKGTGEVDMPGADLLIEEAKRRDARGGSFSLEVKSPMVLERLARFKVMRSLTRKHVFVSKNTAIAEIVPCLDPEICRTCTARVFRECADRPGAD